MCLFDFHFTSIGMILGISCYEIVDLFTIDFHDQDPVVERTFVRVKIRSLIWGLCIPFVSLSSKIM